MSASNQNIINFPDGSDMNDVQAQAIDWAELLQSGRATKQDCNAFEAWLAEDSAHAAAYKMLEQWWRDMDYVAADDSAIEKEIESYTVSERKEKYSTIISRRMIGSIAATFLVVALIMQFSGIFGTKPTNQYETAIGELKTFELEDGTKITLAGNSTLKTHFSETERGAELINGQAYFDVASDKARVFEVLTGNTRVSVIGTQFDIQKNTGDVRISVIEGLVEVAANASADISKQLKAGDQVFAAFNGEIGQVKPFQAETDISWKQGRLEYINVPLSRVISEVNRYRKNKIRLQDNSLANYPITISLAFMETDRLLAGLEQAEVAYIIKQGNEVIIKAR